MHLVSAEAQTVEMVKRIEVCPLFLVAHWRDCFSFHSGLCGVVVLASLLRQPDGHITPTGPCISQQLLLPNEF